MIFKKEIRKKNIHIRKLEGEGRGGGENISKKKRK